MPTNSQEFQPNEEQKEYLDQLITTYYVLINNVTGLHPSEIDLEEKASDVFEMQEVYGYVLAKMHLYFEIEPNYNAYTEFTIFPTLASAYNHIAEQALLKSGLLSPDELQ